MLKYNSNVQIKKQIVLQYVPRILDTYNYLAIRLSVFLFVCFVIFNILDETVEILLTILSSLAQEESRNISENIRWGITRKFESGKVIVNCT